MDSSEQNSAVTLEEHVTRLVRVGKASNKYLEMLMRVFGRQKIEGYLKKLDVSPKSHRKNGTS